jgi:hypothetical protein
MPKALTRKQAEQLATESELRQVRLEARETEALEELSKLGFRTTLHEMGRYVEADDLLGISAGYKPGDCYAVMYGRDGKRKQVSGASAVQALQQAHVWCKWQESLSPDAANRFSPSVDNQPVPETFITQRIAGDTAETRQRRANTERRVISVESGIPELVDAHGTPLATKDEGAR